MPSEFIVPLKNSWDVHAFTNSNAKSFTVLAESEERGPIIIELRNTLCTMFTTNPHYPATLLPI